MNILNGLQVRVSLLLGCWLCLVFLVNCGNVPSSEQAYYFANSDTMLGADANTSKQFAEVYAKKCNEAGRLDQNFYNNAYDIANDPFKLGFNDEQEKKRFISDFAISCKPKSLITPNSYGQIAEFTHDPFMMNLSDSDNSAKAFIWNYLMNCGKENYLTSGNWKKVYDYETNELNYGVIDAENRTRQFFRDCKEIK